MRLTCREERERPDRLCPCHEDEARIPFQSHKGSIQARTPASSLSRRESLAQVSELVGVKSLQRHCYAVVRVQCQRIFALPIFHELVNHAIDIRKGGRHRHVCLRACFMGHYRRGGKSLYRPSKSAYCSACRLKSSENPTTCSSGSY